ncbi:hypothetical protein LNL84_04350 [Vibrio sp. ZSDZ34]|uniref:Uncharacterized protein n=1 Tax=Vibrio gelatinilyticus TaxID=2893468 RepID=A0A9X2AUM7_9VIBR|nr:hypothetical protein [Vibrio gelatinilyticus]MCJ2376059.1 hypothetical protein [Vibrio gelatinilyticus]
MIETQKKDFDSIKKSLIKKNAHVVLEEARRLYALEQERRNGADTKSGLYLTAVAALIAFFSSQAPEFTSQVSWFSVVTFLLAVFQLIRCGIWSLKALKVTGYALLDWKDLIEQPSSADFESNLAKKLLCSLRYNYDLNNDKLTNVNMSYETLISASFWLVIYLVIEIIQSILEQTYSNPSMYDATLYICSWCNFSYT